MPTCKKCGREIAKGTKCEHCKSKLAARVKKVGGAVLSVGLLAVSCAPKILKVIK